MSDNTERIYEPSECVVFRKTDEPFGGLSNMAPGYPLRVAGLTFLTSEALYQTCRFPHIPELQEQILHEKSPMTAKMRIRKYRSDSRADWEAVRVRIMRWCLAVKLAQNYDRFSKLLEATGEKPIVESSRKDPFWGCLPQEDGKLVGTNVLGRLLMQLRQDLRTLSTNEILNPPLPNVSQLTFLGRTADVRNVRNPGFEVGKKREIDAETFESPVLSLATTIGNKVMREGSGRIAGPEFVLEDLFLQIRYARATYALILFMNSNDLRRNNGWREEYAILTWSHVRGLIDCLYNITTILSDPRKNGPLFRLSGLRKVLLNKEETEKQYGHLPEWQKDIENRGALAQRIATEISMDIDQARSGRFTWKTFGRYMSEQHGKDGELERFFRRFTLGSWSEYSSIAHATFEGLLPHAAFFIRDEIPHDRREALSEVFPGFMSMHVGRASIILLCIVTEVQSSCRFEGSRINERIYEAWNAVRAFAEGEEFYAERYKKIVEALEPQPKSETPQLPFDSHA